MAKLDISHLESLWQHCRFWYRVAWVAKAADNRGSGQRLNLKDFVQNPLPGVKSALLSLTGQSFLLQVVWFYFFEYHFQGYHSRFLPLQIRKVSREGNLQMSMHSTPCNADAGPNLILRLRMQGTNNCCQDIIKMLYLELNEINPELFCFWTRLQSLPLQCTTLELRYKANRHAAGKLSR